MAGKYISQFTGEQIDEAIMKALMYNPTENGWVKLPSTEDNPISLDALVSIGNYVIDYIIDGPYYEEDGSKTEILKDTHPVNVCVVVMDDILTQYITIMDDIYYRTYDNTEMVFEEGWNSKKTTNFIYVNDMPENPEKNTIVIIPDENSTEDAPRYTMKIYDEEKYVDVYPSGIMQKSVYDTQGREMDFFQYVDDTYMTMNSTTLGITWNDTDITETFNSEIYSSITVNSEVLVTFKNSSKIMAYSLIEHRSSIHELPIICNSPEIFNLNIEGLDYFYIYDRESTTLIQLDFNGEELATNIIDIETGGIELDRFIGKISLGYNMLSSINLNAIDVDNNIHIIEVSMNSATLVGPAESWDGTEYFLSYNGEKYPFYNEISNSGYMVYYESEIVKAFVVSEEGSTIVKIIDYTEGFETVRSLEIFSNEIFTGISNIYEIFGDYTGYLVTSSGVIYSISTMFEDMFMMRLYQANSFTKWNNIAYDIFTLALFGSSNEVFSNHILYSTQDDSLLMSIEEHLNNTDIHFSQLDRDILETRETKTNVAVQFNRVERHTKDYIDEKVSTLQGEYDSVKSDADDLNQKIEDHISDEDIHPNEELRKYWSDKAEKNHNHILDDKVKIDASQIVSGVIAMERIPSGAKEVVIKVPNVSALYKLTIDDAQNGDRIAVTNVGIYEVVDETKLAYIDGEGEMVLAQEAAFNECGAGTNAYIEWKNVEDTPNTLAGYGIKDSYTKTEAEEVYQSKMEELVKKMEDRYTTFDIAELYSIARSTNKDISTILQEIDNAIAMSQKIQNQDAIIQDLHERITLLAEDLEECESISASIIGLFS